MPDFDDALAAAALRYRLIAAAADDVDGVTAAIRESAAADQLDLAGLPYHRSERTLWRYLKAYRAGRLQGLVRASRQDRGSIRAISREVLERAVELRRESGKPEDPLRATKTIIDILVREKKVAPGELKRSTLDRYFEHEGVSRRQLRRLGQKVFKKILSEAPFELVLTDFHHGPYVRVGNEGRRALLCAFIDHFSRYVPEARYYLHEDYVALRFGFRRLLAAFGRMRKLYRDNGGAYQSTRFRVACDHLDIAVPPSKSYAPECRGLIERFNRTLKEQFETEVRRRDDLVTLDELNAYFQAWLSERYHRDTHSETGEAPLDRFQRPNVARPSPDLADVDELLRLREQRSVHKQWSTVEVLGSRFVVSPSLRGRKVFILFDPSDLAHVLVEFDGRVIERAYPQRAGEPPTQPTEDVRGPAKTDYLGLLRADHEARSQAELSALRLRPPGASPELPLVELIALFERCRGRVLSTEEHSDVSAFFRKMRPIEPEPARAALDGAHRRLGATLHIRVYIDAIQTHLVHLRARGGAKQ